MSRSKRILELRFELITLQHMNMRGTPKYNALLTEVNRLQEEGAIGAFLGVFAILSCIALLPVTLFLFCMFDSGLKNYFRLLKQGYVNIFELGMSMNK